MSKQPEALRLAERLNTGVIDREGADTIAAAAELRRLVAEHEEDQRVIAVWRGRTQRAEAQRDALLEALKEADDYTRHPDYDWPVEFSRRVSDAINKAEGGQ